MTTTYREPPITREQLEDLLAQYAAEFSSMEALHTSYEKWKAWCRSKSMPLTLEGGRRWLERDLAQDQVMAFQVLTPDPDKPVVHYELTPEQEAMYAARGDLHDWTGIDEPEYDHVARCKRCQMGIESRRIVDERAIAAGKLPFPSMSRALRSARGAE